MLKVLRLSLLFCLYTQVVSTNTMCCRQRRHAATKISKTANYINSAVCTVSAIGAIGCLITAIDSDDTAQRCLGVMLSGLNGMVAGISARLWIKECEDTAAVKESSEYRNTYYRAINNRDRDIRELQLEQRRKLISERKRTMSADRR